MDFAETIVSSLIVIVILILVGVIIMNQAPKFLFHKSAEQQQVFLDESYSGNLNALLDVTEPVSGQSFGTLLANSIYYHQPVMDFERDGAAYTINVSKEFEELLDEVFGEDKYYAKVSAQTNLSLFFIFDGSDSLEEERRLLAQNLKSITDSVQNYSGVPISDQVFVLSDNITKCNLFLSENITCAIIDDSELYRDNCDDSSADYREKYCFIRPNVTDSGRNAIDYFEPDWASGSAYVASLPLIDPSSIALLFPVSDELSTSSIPDQCFKTDFSSTPWHRLACDVCSLSNNSETIIERSLSYVSNLVDFLISEKQNVLVYPINAHPASIQDCDYNYFYGGRNELIQYSIEQNGGQPPDNGRTYCGEDVCKGCVDYDFSDNYVCFHPEVGANITFQMEFLANSTRGDLILLSNVDDLPSKVNLTISDLLAHMILEVGQKNDYGERIVVERNLLLPGLGNNYALLRLWVYTGEASRARLI